MKDSRLILLFVLISGFSYGQVIINGTVEGKEGVEGIHVVNKSRKQYATTNVSGEFSIQVKEKDTLVISAVQYKLQTLIISETNIKNKSLKIIVESYVNQLDEVVVGKVFTGDLYSDIAVLDVKPNINFYDVGIPGYTGKKKTTNEKLLEEAGDFKAKQLLGLLGGSLPLNPILNAISGRTKRLKKRVALDANEALMYKIINTHAKSFFSQNPLDETLKMDFFYFCSEDETFTERCKNNGIEVLGYLKEKYIAYKLNRTSKE